LSRERERETRSLTERGGERKRREGEDREKREEDEEGRKHMV